MFGPIGPFNPMIGPNGPFYHGLDISDPGNIRISGKNSIKTVSLVWVLPIYTAYLRLAISATYLGSIVIC